MSNITKRISLWRRSKTPSPSSRLKDQTKKTTTFNDNTITNEPSVSRDNSLQPPDNKNNNKNNKNHIKSSSHDIHNNNNKSQQIDYSKFVNPKLLNKKASMVTRSERTELQNLVKKLIQSIFNLKEELEIRASQLSILEENFANVSDGAKLIAKKAMEQMQQITELKKALELKNKQVDLYRANTSKLQTNSMTVLPVHLRQAFSNFLKLCLQQQKSKFSVALQQFVTNQIRPEQMPQNTTKQELLQELGKIGNALTMDYVNELELRLNGTFASTSNIQNGKQLGEEISQSMTGKKKINEDNKKNGIKKPNQNFKPLTPGPMSSHNKPFKHIPPTLGQLKPSKSTPNILQNQQQQQPINNNLLSPRSRHMPQNRPGFGRRQSEDRLERPPVQEFDIPKTNPQDFYGLGSLVSRTSTVGLINKNSFSSSLNVGVMEQDLSINEDLSDLDDSGDDDDMSDIDENDIQNLMKDKETQEMMKMLQQLGQQEVKKSGVFTPKGGSGNQGDSENKDNNENGHNKNQSSGENSMWSHFLNAKQSMLNDKPSTAPKTYRVNQHKKYTELRDCLDILPPLVAQRILTDQNNNFRDRVRDITIQRGCWPLVRYKSNRMHRININVDFDKLLLRIKSYMNMKKSKSLLTILDPQKTTGFRLHQLTAIVNNRNDSTSFQEITGFNFRIGRMWSAQMNCVKEAISFWNNLDKPATMLLLGPTSAEKSALVRVITRLISNKQCTALVDTRSTVGGYDNGPLECGNALRYFVNNIQSQSHVIESTRNISPQVVVVDEVLNDKDIDSLLKLQSEGISTIIGTNCSTLQSLLGHKTFSKLLPPQNRLDYNPKKKSKSSIYDNIMSPYSVILEINYNASSLKIYKNVPQAVSSIKSKLDPKCEQIRLQFQSINDTINNINSNGNNNNNSLKHKRDQSVMHFLMNMSTSQVSNTNYNLNLNNLSPTNKSKGKNKNESMSIDSATYTGMEPKNINNISMSLDNKINLNENESKNTDTEVEEDYESDSIQNREHSNTVNVKRDSQVIA